jgi:hypothetical protein
VTVVATPVVHVAAAAPSPSLYPIATPGATPRAVSSSLALDDNTDSDVLNVTSYSDHDNTTGPHLFNISLSYHDAFVAFGDWFENAGFEVRVTPLRLLVAAFIYGCIQMVFMIVFRDYKLFNKAVMCLVRGLYSVSVPTSLIFFLRPLTDHLVLGLRGALDVAFGQLHVPHVRPASGRSGHTRSL